VEQNSDSIKRDNKIATGWAVKEVLEKANVEEKTNGTNSVKNDWLSRSLKRSYLSTCTKEDVETKAEWLRTKITVAARASLKSETLKAKREKWNTFLQNAKGDEVWKVSKPNQNRILGAITVGVRNLGTFHMEAKRGFGAKGQLRWKWEK
jgi:hypothetical protein